MIELLIYVGTTMLFKNYSDRSWNRVRYQQRYFKDLKKLYERDIITFTKLLSEYDFCMNLIKNAKQKDTYLIFQFCTIIPILISLTVNNIFDIFPKLLDYQWFVMVTPYMDWLVQKMEPIYQLFG